MHQDQEGDQGPVNMINHFSRHFRERVATIIIPGRHEVKACRGKLDRKYPVAFHGQIQVHAMSTVYFL